MFTILDYSSALEYSIIRRYTNIVYYYYYIMYIVHTCFSPACITLKNYTCFSSIKFNIKIIIFWGKRVRNVNKNTKIGKCS